MPSLVKNAQLCSIPPPATMCVYVVAHLGQEDLVLSLPPSTGTPTTHIKRIFSGLANNLLEAMETNLIRVLINLSLQAKQSQEAKWKGGAGLFFSPSRHTSVHRIRPTLGSWELTFF